MACSEEFILKSPVARAKLAMARAINRFWSCWQNFNIKKSAEQNSLNFDKWYREYLKISLDLD